MPKFNVLLLVLLSLYTHVTVNHLDLKYIYIVLGWPSG